MCLEWYSSKQMNTNMLNALGGEGWELIQIVNGEVVLKRKLKEEKKSEKEEIVDNTNFEECWKLYRRKGSKKKALEQWLKLTPEEQEQVLNHIPAYVESVSDIKFQKDFFRYLRDKCFLNVVYKDGKTIFDAENKEETSCDNKLVIGGTVYR